MSHICSSWGCFPPWHASQATAAMATHSLENNGDLLTLQAGVATLVAELAASHG